MATVDAARLPSATFSRAPHGLSHHLATLLRHNNSFRSLPVDLGGWVPLAAVMNSCKRNRLFDFGDILALLRLQAVSRHEKPRYQLLVAVSRRDNRIDSLVAMRALQGHAIPFLRPERLCRPLAPMAAAIIDELHHRTGPDALDSILFQGLIPGGLSAGKRASVHFAPFGLHDPRLRFPSREDRSCDVIVSAAVLIGSGFPLRATPLGSIFAFCQVPWKSILRIVIQRDQERTRRIYDPTWAVANPPHSDTGEPLLLQPHGEGSAFKCYHCGLAARTGVLMCVSCHAGFFYGPRDLHLRRLDDEAQGNVDALGLPRMHLSRRHGGKGAVERHDEGGRMKKREA